MKKLLSLGLTLLATLGLSAPLKSQEQINSTQVPSSSPPRNVIYYLDKNNTISLSEIAKLPYTDVIISFLIPINASNLALRGEGAAFDSNLQNNVKTLHQAGKHVLVSFGGAALFDNDQNGQLTTKAYQYYAKNVDFLVTELVNKVKTYDFDGVDIDYEDNNGFNGKGGYDGVVFLSALTKGLANKLPSGPKIITHAPQSPYWDTNFYNAPYTRLWKQAGNQITWINNQFYNNPDYDKTSALKLKWYKNIAAITSPQKLLLGSILSTTEGEGYLPSNQLIKEVINPLKAEYKSSFGGVMGFQFSDDQNGSWGKEIGGALGIK